jgi:hypothetical protein
MVQVLGLLASACNEPHYVEPFDGGTREQRVTDDGSAALASDTDAGGRPDDRGGELSSEAQALTGKYAIQVRFHGQDSTLGTLAPMSNELILLATIEAVDGGDELRMTAQLCRDHGVVRGPFTQVLAEVVHADRQPPRVWDLVVKNGSFYTKGVPLRLGYEESAPPGCTPGGKLARLPEQVWLGAASATCSCPTSDLPPTQPDDCRVTDLDQDSHPGVTIATTGALVGENYVRVRDTSEFLDGIIATGKRHRSAYDRVEDLYQLECTGRGGCTRANLRACPVKFNTALFAPLPDQDANGAAWRCETLMQAIEAGEYVSSEPLTFPSGC